MGRLATAALTVLVGVMPAAAGDPAPPRPKDVGELLQEALDLWHMQEDYNGALASFNRAVELAPSDAQVRLQRAMFFESVVELVGDDDKEKFRELARDDYTWVAEQDPDSTRAGISRDALTRLRGAPLLARPAVMCPKEAAAAHERAEAFYGARRFQEAVPEYEKASAGCPEAATYWVDYADAHYMLGTYDKAKELFERAVTVDPWLRSAHRFLADTEGHLGHGEAAVHQAALAVVSDPEYEAAWASLRGYADAVGRGWKRSYGVKPDVRKEPGSGDQKITIALPEATSSPSAGKKAGKSKPVPDDIGWMSYSMSKALAFSGTVIEPGPKKKPVERSIDPKSTSALETERIAVRSGLDAWREQTKKRTPPDATFWSMMDRAEKAGFTDEAIFLHMFDAALAAEYAAYREKNAARLVEYLETLIAPNR